MKRNKTWKKLLYSFLVILFINVTISKIAVFAEELTEKTTESTEQTTSETEEITEHTEQTITNTEELQELSFTDENGNNFTYIIDSEGNVIITSITVSGQALTIPTSIENAPVTEISNGTLCVIKNSEIKIPELIINCSNIDANAFNNLTIGTLVIGENVKEFSLTNEVEFGVEFTYGQFANSTIEKVIFQAKELVIGHSTENYMDDFRGPFYQTQIGELEIGNNVTIIPELLFCDAMMELEELTLQTERIGAYAFSGENISIGHLTIGENVKVFEEYSNSDTLFHYWEQFAETTIGTYTYLSNELELEHAQESGTYNNNQYAPFRNSTIGNLEIGNNVTRLPELFLHDANIHIQELHLTQTSIGAYAFSGSGISIDTLILEDAIEKLEEWYFSDASSHHWEQFSKTTIGHLIYKATNAIVINDIAEIDGITTRFFGPFDNATVSKFTLDNNVISIPNFLLKDSICQIEELDLHVSDVGAYAFSSQNLTIRKLTLGEELKVFHNVETTSSNYQYWEQFSQSTIGEVHYNIPSLTLEEETKHDTYCYGPFYLSKIGHLYLSENVTRYPAYCFLDAYIEQDELEIHAESIGVRAFSGKNISIETLTIGKELQTFEWADSGFSTSFRQFMDCTIGTLIYLPINAETGEECNRGIFETATIGTLVIDSAVQKIPNYLFYNAIIKFEEFSINVPDIGYYSFASEGITFEKLTIGESVCTFRMNEKGYNRAFNANIIDFLCYNATQGQMETLSGSVYGPFSYETQINELTIGENVKVLPYGCFREAEVDLTELTLNNIAIGYATFYGDNIHIGTLNIGNNVSYDGVVSNQMNCFKTAKIDILNYNSNGIESEWSTSKSSYGMFAQSIIGQLNIGEDVKAIPAFWFRSATLTQENLTLSCAWSPYSFYSNKINIGTLTLNGDMKEFTHIDNNNSAFSTTTIGTLVYNLPNAVFTSTKPTASGPFYNANITTLILGENVTYLDYRLLRGNTLTDCYIYPVNASETFLSQSLTESYLPICTNLHIHYNSDFKNFFSQEVTEYHWLCIDYFDTTYGEKIYDEQTDEYSIELLKTCSICGYEEQMKEELDGSYDVYLSIPIEISLHFDAEQKSYIGQEMIFAYGTLGNAYEGVSLSIDNETAYYGTAIMEENTYDISDYLSVGFVDGESAIFDTNQLLENATHISKGNTDHVHQKQMTVSINGMAFIESGAGEYKIPIPLRFELIK